MEEKSLVSYKDLVFYMLYILLNPIEVFDDAAWKIRLHLDGHLNQLVEMVGAHLKHLQNPGENPALLMCMHTLYCTL